MLNTRPDRKNSRQLKALENLERSLERYNNSLVGWRDKVKEGSNTMSAEYKDVTTRYTKKIAYTEREISILKDKLKIS